MLELLIVAGAAGAIVAAVAGGITIGNRVVDQKLRYEQKLVRSDQPIVAHTVPRDRRSA